MGEHRHRHRHRYCVCVQAPPGAEVINAKQKLVMPGGVDPHTHLHLPYMGANTCDDHFSGQAAAVAGGTTMHIDFALPIYHDIEAGFNEWKSRAEQRSCIDYGFHQGVTRWDQQVGCPCVVYRSH